MEEYKKWNLDIRSERISKLFDGKSESYEIWREDMVDMCASQWFGWRNVLEQLVKRSTPLTSTVVKATNQWMGLNGGQLTVI